MAAQRVGLFVGDCELSAGLVVGRGSLLLVLDCEKILVDAAAGHEDEDEADDQAQDEGNGLDG